MSNTLFVDACDRKAAGRRPFVANSSRSRAKVARCYSYCILVDTSSGQYIVLQQYCSSTHQSPVSRAIAAVAGYASYRSCPPSTPKHRSAIRADGEQHASDCTVYRVQ